MAIYHDIAVFVCMLFALFLMCSIPARGSDPGTKEVNIAQFGTPWFLMSEHQEPVYIPQVADSDDKSSLELAGGQMVQIEWRQPRDVKTVRIAGPAIPEADKIEIQWWYRIWPDGGSGGWQRLDDPFNGKFVTLETEAVKENGFVIFKAKPLDKTENPDVNKTGFDFRRTYKLRIIFHSASTVDEIEVYSGAIWKSAELKLEWKPKSDKKARWTGQIEARNAKIVSVSSGDSPGSPVTVKVDYSDAPERLSEDRGIVTFRADDWDSFSVFVDDVIREGGIYVRDIDAFVSDASQNIVFDGFRPKGDIWDGTVIEKVSRLPEQSMEQVKKAIPTKPSREAHLGLPDMRQEITITQSGNIELHLESLRAPGKDLERRPWDVYLLRYAFSTFEKPIFTEEGDRSVTRNLEKNYLPLVHCRWENDGISYHRESFVTNLIGTIGGPDGKRKCDDPLVLLDKLEIANTGKSKKTAYVWFELTLKTPCIIEKDGLIRLKTDSAGNTHEKLTPTRGRFDINGKGEFVIVPDCVPAKPGSPEPDPKKVGSNPREVFRYTVKLAPGEKHTVYFNVPYIELLDAEELKALKSKSFDKERPKILAYWEKIINQGMKYDVPEQVLNDLWKANLWHVLMTTDQDPNTGLYEHGAATMHYLVYANETAMVAQSLSMRGNQKDALNMMLPFLKCQSVKPLPGNFKSKDGLLYSAHPDAENDPYTAQGYNMHHGWALWKLAEHYKYTHNKEWLSSIADNLVAACDWITRERKATMEMNPDGTRPIEYGLAPAGDLEDVEEYLYFYATNAYYHVGLKLAAELLAEIGHPEATRLKRDAEDYRQDLLESLKNSAATTPVVKLKDGTWIPYIPARAYQTTHRKEGWIREGLYPALHILDGEIVEPGHRLVDWILQDLEDNIFLSRESGYGVEDQLQHFFNFGGFNLQPNLLPNIMAHLMRDEPKHFIRIFYNMCRASLWEDIMCFAEWVPYYGKGGGPLYKTPDEAKFIQYMRYMLVFEDGDTLKLAMATPRAWMEDGKKIVIEGAATFFGKMDMKIESEIKQGRIKATIKPPLDKPAKSIWLRIRHHQNKPIQRVTVNGRQWADFDVEKELIILPADSKKLEIVTHY